MTRATEIADRFVKERNLFHQCHSTLDLLAMAHDDALNQRDQAEARTLRAEGELDSMCTSISATVTKHTEAMSIQSLDASKTWVLTMGLKQAVRMTCAHPSKWDKAALANVIKETADAFAHQLWAAAMKEKN